MTQRLLTINHLTNQAMTLPPESVNNATVILQLRMQVDELTAIVMKSSDATHLFNSLD
jgi:hypothetical protein